MLLQLVFLLKNSLTSLMHHFSTPRAGMCNQSRCSISCLRCQLFTPPQCIIHIGCHNHPFVLGNNGHTRCAYTPTWVETFIWLYHLHGYMHVSILHWLACMYMYYGIQSGFYRVSMYVYMHLVFKELRTHYSDNFTIMHQSIYLLPEQECV